jgi:hypothetical protein
MSRVINLSMAERRWSREDPQEIEVEDRPG